MTLKWKFQKFMSKIFRNNKLQLINNSLTSKAYLNVGCGANRHKDFINLDYYWSPNLDLVWDITKKIPLKDSSLLGIFTEHCLEHISYLDSYKLLRDFKRMLKPGGYLRIVVPDAELFLDIYQRGKLGERVYFPNGLTGYNGVPSSITPLLEINRTFRGHGHRFAYDYATLKIMLLQAGFVDIQKKSFMCGSDRALLIDSEKRAAESLYVEASVSKQTSQFNTNDAELYYIQGTAKVAWGGYARAVEDFTQALRLNPDFAEVYYDRGRLHKILGNKQAAMQDMQKAAELFSAQGNIEYYQEIQEIINELR
ncbi:methyltransferase domain-containing protein [Coleofasciculus sp. E1-EBD-02]|uniref:methyltransferase domain-containing protein n=1 Tax=Coleofasciculus sp. E1-EBD-02 TaxID=3068481 RepID=UPI0032FBBDEA